MIDYANTILTKILKNVFALINSLLNVFYVKDKFKIIYYIILQNFQENTTQFA